MRGLSQLILAIIITFTLYRLSFLLIYEQIGFGQILTFSDHGP